MSYRYCRHELDNGLTVIGEVDGGAHTAAVGFFVRTGARDEPGTLMGVSHFLEHMMFKGTEELSAEEINRRFDAMGASNNAYTSHELTCFYARVLPEFVEGAVDTLGRMMRPALREEDFATERGVILEEIAMYRDNPFWVLYEAVSERHYRGHPLGHRVLGTEETIRGMTAEGMRGYFARRYTADRTVVAVSGAVDFEAVCAQVERLCGGWARGDGGGGRSAPETGGGRFEMRQSGVNRAYMIGLAAAPGVGDERRYAAALAAQVLGGGDNSRLHWALVEPGLAEEAQAGYDPHDGVGQWVVYATGDPGDAERIWEVVAGEVRALAGTVTEDDLARLRGRYETAMTVDGERPCDRMQRLGRVWTYLGMYRSLEEELERIRGVGVEEVREVCEAFPLEPTTVGVLLPE